MQLFMSYLRGEETTPFAHELKLFLEQNGFDVWMDVEGIQGGADFMSAIGDAIMASQGMVAIIDEKFCGSTYCNNELAMAQGNGLQLFPILFRGMSFDAMPNGLKYMLASINVIPFPDAASDAAGMVKMHDHVCSMLKVAPRTGPRRHAPRRHSMGLNGGSHPGRPAAMALGRGPRPGQPAAWPQAGVAARERGTHERAVL